MYSPTLFVRDLLVLLGNEQTELWVDQFWETWMEERIIGRKMESYMVNVAGKLGIPTSIFDVLNRAAFSSPQQLRFLIEHGEVSSSLSSFLSSTLRMDRTTLATFIDAMFQVMLNPQKEVCVCVHSGVLPRSRGAHTSSFQVVFWQLWRVAQLVPALQKKLKIDDARRRRMEVVYHALRGTLAGRGLTDEEIRDLLIMFGEVAGQKVEHLLKQPKVQHAVTRGIVSSGMPKAGQQAQNVDLADIALKFDDIAPDLDELDPTGLSTDNYMPMIRTVLTLAGYDSYPKYVNVLASLLGVPAYVIELCVGVGTNNRKMADTALAAILQRLLNEEEGVCKGLVGMIRGDMGMTEDIVRALNMDVDTAEALLTIACGQLSEIEASDVVRHVEPLLGVENGR